MQLLPATAAEEGLLPGQSGFDPKINIALGAKHFAKLLQTYQDEHVFALAAYNAGQEAVQRWRSRYPELEPNAWIEMIAYPETKNYVKKVLRAEAVYQSLVSER